MKYYLYIFIFIISIVPKIYGGNYKLLINDYNINYNIENTNSEANSTYFIPIEIIPYSDDMESLFLGFSYGGRHFKDNEIYGTALEQNPTELMQLKESIFKRFLHSSKNNISYELLAYPDSQTELKPQIDILNENDTIQIYDYERIHPFANIQTGFYIKIPEETTYKAENYYDIITITLYSGDIYQSTQVVKDEYQLFISFHVPKQIKTQNISLTPTEIPNQYIFNIQFIATTATTLIITKAMVEYTIESITDGIKPIPLTSKEYLYHFKFSSTFNQKEFLLHIKPSKNITLNENKAIEFYYQLKPTEI